MGNIRIPMAQPPVLRRRQPRLLRPPGVPRPILPICLILVIPIHITDRVRIRRVLISKDEVFLPPITSNSHRSFWLFFCLTHHIIYSISQQPLYNPIFYLRRISLPPSSSSQKITIIEERTKALDTPFLNFMSQNKQAIVSFQVLETEEEDSC